MPQGANPPLTHFILDLRLLTLHVSPTSPKASLVPVAAGGGPVSGSGRMSSFLSLHPVSSSSAKIASDDASWHNRSLADWSEPLLALIFRQLRPVDLAQCRAVCSRWHRAASDPMLQAHCFMQMYPVDHRQRLQRALGAGFASSCLRLWSGSRAPDDTRRAGQQELAVLERLSYRRLFHALVQAWRQADRFSRDAIDEAGFGHTPFMYFASSPDGRFLVGIAWQYAVGMGVHLYIFRYGEDAVRLVSRIDGAYNPRGMVFGADSRRLCIVDTMGRLHDWQLDAQGHWESVGNSVLYPTAGGLRVCGMAASPDGQYMVVEEGEIGVSVFGLTAAGGWQKQTCWRWQEEGEPGLERLSLADISFSRDGQVFVLVNNQCCCVCWRVGRDWRWSTLEKTDVRSGRGAALTADGLQVALFSPDRAQRGAGQGGVTAGRLRLWSLARGAARQGPGTQEGVWVCVSNRCTRAGVFWGAHAPPVAFSPDGGELVCPYGDNERDGRLCVLSVSAQGAGHLKDVLQFQSPARNQSDRDPVCDTPQFSVTGSCLAAAAWRGVQIWQRGADLHWVAVAWVGNESWIFHERIGSSLLAFSPDGYHCAASAGGQVAVWGPGRDGKYRCKLSLALGIDIGRLLFSPDGTRLVVVSDKFSFPGANHDHNKVYCLRLTPEYPGAEEVD